MGENSVDGGRGKPDRDRILPLVKDRTGITCRYMPPDSRNPADDIKIMRIRFGGKGGNKKNVQNRLAAMQLRLQAAKSEESVRSSVKKFLEGTEMSRRKAP